MSITLRSPTLCSVIGSKIHIYETQCSPCGGQFISSSAESYRLSFDGVLAPWRLLANSALFLLEEQACSTQVNFRFFAVLLVVRERHGAMGKLAYC